ncbi:hypothetical protein J6590_071497 [Homalodisca vitripennis]|nr:hypothetical protein J6590_071497 [Homalodisca vitripennis]
MIYTSDYARLVSYIASIEHSKASALLTCFTVHSSDLIWSITYLKSDFEKVQNRFPCLVAGTYVGFRYADKPLLDTATPRRSAPTFSRESHSEYLREQDDVMSVKPVVYARNSSLQGYRNERTPSPRTWTSSL